MRRTLAVEGSEEARRVEVTRDEGGAVRVRIRETEDALTARPALGGFILVRGRQTVEAGVTSIRPGTVAVRIGGEVFRITADRSRRPRAAGRSSKGGAAGVEVRAPMPGKVVRILREAGHTVAAGDGVVVFEAMKMQNEIPAPVTGVIAKLGAAPGALLDGDAFLFAVSPAPSPRTQPP